MPKLVLFDIAFGVAIMVVAASVHAGGYSSFTNSAGEISCHYTAETASIEFIPPSGWKVLCKAFPRMSADVLFRPVNLPLARAPAVITFTTQARDPWESLAEIVNAEQKAAISAGGFRLKSLHGFKMKNGALLEGFRYVDRKSGRETALLYYAAPREVLILGLLAGDKQAYSRAERSFAAVARNLVAGKGDYRNATTPKIGCRENEVSSMSAVSTSATENHSLHVYWPKFPRGKGPDNRFFASQHLQDRLLRIHRGRVEVLVDRPGKRVNLFLTSYAPTLWDIKTCANVRLGLVIAVGIYEPVVKVVPEETDPNGCSSVKGRLLEASGPCTFALRGAVPNPRQAALKLAGALLGSPIATTQYLENDVGFAVVAESDRTPALGQSSEK